jgi:hypothetical protein
VNTGDFNGDGLMDIIASNWGRNSRYEPARSRPLRLYYGDLDGNGTVDMIEAGFDSGLNKYVPERLFSWMAQGLPLLRDRFKTHRAYAEASAEDCLAALPKPAKLLEANWLETTLFLNRGDHFEPHPLPAQAQFAPAFGICVADFDGDGHEDVFLAQNFFATPADTSRYDAGRGLWLRGDGNGGLTPVSGQESGVIAYGEQRSCAVSDYDRDGRVDLVVSQNGAATRLFHNKLAKPGLRVRIHGSPGNPTGIGAVIRVVFDEKPGPAREIHAGSGYWSQDSAVQVLGTPRPPTRVLVRWPGGKVTNRDLTLGLTEIDITP